MSPLSTCIQVAATLLKNMNNLFSTNSSPLCGLKQRSCNLFVGIKQIEESKQHRCDLFINVTTVPFVPFLVFSQKKYLIVPNVPIVHLHLFRPKSHLFRPKSHLFRHESRLFRHESRLLRPKSRLLRHESHLFRHESHLFRHESHLFRPKSHLHRPKSH